MAISRVVSLLLVAAGSLTAQLPDTIVRPASKAVHNGVADLVKEVSIGKADGDDNYMLGAITDIAVAPNGTIYVWDPSVPAVRMFDATGKFVKNIGHKGRGPGEYVSGAAIAVTPKGSLLLWDPGNARINVYSASGDVVTSWPTLSGGSGSAMGRGLLKVDTAGTAYVRTMIFKRTPGAFTPPKHGWLRFRPDGSLRDTVFPPAAPSEMVLSANAGGSFSNTIVPFAPAQNTEVSPLGYFVTARSDRIALDLHDTPGKVTSLRRPITPRPVTSAERDSARADVTERMRKVDPAWSWNSSDIPKTKSVFSDLFVAGDGRIWVEVEKGPKPPSDPNTPDRGDVMMTMSKNANGGAPRSSWSCPSSGWSVFDVYEPSGRYLGQVKVPERVDPIIERGDSVWATTCTEDDIPMVVRYRINWR